MSDYGEEMLYSSEATNKLLREQNELLDDRNDLLREQNDILLRIATVLEHPGEEQ